MTEDQLAAEQGAFMQEQRSKREAAYREGFDDGANEAYAEGRREERAELEPLLAWAYGKLAYRSFDNIDDALKMDEIKLLLLQPIL
jgi:flagellar biosynthesis/type III secretory pathway protein FliH